jgi:hypothetical protein
MFWAFKLNFIVDFLAFFATFSKNWAKFQSIFWLHWSFASSLLSTMFFLSPMEMRDQGK